jgi:NADH dehydrogenase FAD-containing subunit
MASAIALPVRAMLRSDFRRIDPSSARIVLVDIANRVLGSFSGELLEVPDKRLGRLVVEARLGRGVDLVDENGVIIAGERISSKTVIWTAGVAPLRQAN